MVEKQTLDVYEEQARSIIEGSEYNQLVDVLKALDSYRAQSIVPEALGSCGLYMYGPGGAEILITSRGVDLESAWEQLVTFVNKRLQEGYKPVIKREGANRFSGDTTQSTTAVTIAPQTTQVGAAVAQPAVATNTTNASEGASSMPLTKLYANVTSGKTYWKIEGGRFKFPANVWPEVLVAAGFDVEKLSTTAVYDLMTDGWVGEYEKNDKGYPKKITRMWKTKTQ